MLAKWIKQGAAWPNGIDKPSQVLTHWSFNKPARAALPQVKHNDWVRNPIDAFVLAKLEAEGMNPSPQADQSTLCRRLYLDLIGLPPSPSEVEAFVSDSSPDAYEKLVEKLQSNPHYGERWARIWLDCARYADSAGYGADPLRKTCFRYRDWVIDAFNRNIPYDQFTIEQLAGDLLPHPTVDQLIATGFNRNTMTNTEGGTDAEEFRVAAVKDRVETSVQVWMGLTMGCAQCHTHKYDPITNREYYQLFAMFNQTEDANRQDESPTIPTPSAQDEAKIEHFKQNIATARIKFRNRAFWKDAQAEWEKSIMAHPTEWVALDPLSFTSSNTKSPVTRNEDGSLLLAESTDKKTTYTLTSHVDLKGITAFRVEAVSDASLPNKALKGITTSR